MPVKKREEMTAEELEACKKRGKKYRARGKVGEREVANILKEYGFSGERGVQYNGRRGNADVIGLDGMHIEVKRVDERLNLPKAIAQSESDSRSREIPIVCHRKNGEKWYVTLDMRTLIKAWSILSKEERENVITEYEFRNNG